MNNFKKKGLKVRIGLFFMIFFVALMLQNQILEVAYDNPEPITAYLNGRLPSSDPNQNIGSYKMEIAYPNHTFNDVSVIVSPPVNDINHPTHNLLFVGTADGMIYSFPNTASVTTAQMNTVADLTSSVFARGETISPTHPRDTWDHYLDGGLINMVFHPEFCQSGSPNANYVFVLYTGRLNNMNVVKLSRFTVSYNPIQLAPGSELVLIAVPKRGPSHYGGGLCFDNNGLLYVAFGDGMDPPFGNQPDRDYFFNTIQGLNTFYGKVLRIDVDKDPVRSHQPVNFLTTEYGGISGVDYWIPNDNPFNGTAGGLEEIYTLGNRAPHRMTYDPVTNQIWEGEVGWNTREEINLIESGKNYQWPRFEGNLDLNQTFTNYSGTFATGVSQSPTWDVTRPGGRYAIIGGYVYRGNDLPYLRGKYIAAMFGSGEIYSFTLNVATGLSAIETIAIKPGDKEIHTFGLDQDGEIYVGGNGSDKIYKLVNAGGPPVYIPQTLSEIDAFADLNMMQPNPGILPYEPRNPFWSDGAEKYRWVAIPNDGTHDTAQEDVVFSESGNWTFPIGSVFIKHFEFPDASGQIKKLETRFLVRGSDGNYFGLSYRWRPDQTDADLVPFEGITEPITTIFGNHEWTFPGRTVCMNCHNSSKGFVLGANTLQLNHEIEYGPGQLDNQLDKWNALGMFSEDIGQNHLRAPLQFDPTADLTQRARILLDVNCAYCHNPNSGTPANFDASYLRPLNETGLIYGVPGNELGLTEPYLIKPMDINHSIIYQRMIAVHDNIAMPPIAKGRVYQEGVDLIETWINSLDPTFYESELLLGSLILHHQMDENTGNSVQDATFYQNSGTLIGPVWAAGYSMSGLNFDGINDYVSVDHDPSLQIADEITLSAWVNATDIDDWDGVITKGLNNSPYALQLWSNGSIRFTANWNNPPGGNGFGSWNSTGMITTNAWHHIAVTYDQSTIKFYIDGNLDSQVSYPDLVFGNNEEILTLGADLPGGDEYFTGLMDDVRIYTKALTPGLIYELYQLNRPPVAAFNASTEGTVFKKVFDAAASYDPDSDPLGYFWDFGDGTTSSLPNPTHTYRTTGVFNVSLTVSDGILENTLTMPVNITCFSIEPLVYLDAAELSNGTVSVLDNGGLLGGQFTHLSGSQPTVGDVAGRRAITFSGANDFISNFNSPVGIIGNNSYTVVLEIFNPVISGEETALAWGYRGGPAATNAQFNYGNNPSYGAVGHWGDPADIGFNGGVPTAGIWHTIAYTYAGGVNGLEKIYVNGVLNAQEPKTLNIHSGQPIHLASGRVGAAGGSILFFSGSIAKAVVFDDELSAANLSDIIEGNQIVDLIQNCEYPPLASFSIFPVTGFVSSEITFDGTSSSDPDGNISAYAWDFGDGTTATGTMVTKSFNTAGTFAVTLTVTDNDGHTDGIIKTITIAEKQNQTINFAVIADKYTIHHPFNIKAMASSGLPVSFKVVSGPANISGNTVSLTGQPGIVTIAACQEGDLQFSAAPETTQSFEVGFDLTACLQPSTIGNASNMDAASEDNWKSNLVINLADIYQNTTNQPQTVSLESFNFFAKRMGSPVTPFAVKITGINQFIVVSIGQTRTQAEYNLGANTFDFAENADCVLLQPNEIIAFGFMDAFPDGSNGGINPVVPFEDGSDPVWLSGGPLAEDAAALLSNTPPIAGTATETALFRSYRFNVGICIDDVRTVVAVKAFLQGPFSSSEQKMGDLLKLNNYLPIQEPYSTLGLTVLNGGIRESLNPEALNFSENNAIVDWVFLQIRSKDDPTQVVATRSALIQSDGDIVDIDGVSPVIFYQVLPDYYYLSIQHRNHLSIMTKMPVQLNNIK